MASNVKSRKTPQKKKFALSDKFKKNTEHIPNQDYHEMISQAAYYKAEQRGFIPGFEEEDWLEAENEILSMLNLQ
ncbi:MAG: DUF2934 domain-containing protein [Gammaproteobacteria bacterium]|nr:DUF2934 domain-containing protein [Gammaproteobacteria bacterium]NNC67991.1 DUF2934 domain-containing protein [Gammaproteobacteria bacterium]